jgi:dTDP-4-dehydrorhamnose reductase
MILVFGAGGQLGSELESIATERRIELKGFTRAEADIADGRRVAEIVGGVAPRLVVNAAAYTDVDGAERDWAGAVSGNVTGPRNLAEACARANIPLVHVSTDHVFDGTKDGPYAETDPVAPANAYGRSKELGERAVREALPRHLILRTAWLYGRFGHNFVKTIMAAARKRPQLEVVADQEGSPSSSAELAAAILAIAPRLDAAFTGWGTYHFAAAGVASRHELASHVVEAQAELAGHRVPVLATATPPPPEGIAVRPKRTALDSSGFARLFGITPAHWRPTVTRVVRETIEQKLLEP